MISVELVVVDVPIFYHDQLGMLKVFCRRHVHSLLLGSSIFHVRGMFLKKLFSPLIKFNCLRGFLLTSLSRGYGYDLSATSPSGPWLCAGHCDDDQLTMTINEIQCSLLSFQCIFWCTILTCWTGTCLDDRFQSLFCTYWNIGITTFKTKLHWSSC